MFSDKEFLLVFGGGLSTALLYMVCKLSVTIDISAAEVIGFLLPFLQLIPLSLYLTLLVIHINLLYESRKFMGKSVDGSFKNTFKLLNYSEVITVICVFWVFLIFIDIPTFYTAWASEPAGAAKMSFFPYWLFDTFIRGGNYNWRFAVLWHLPFTIFTVIFEIITYSKYFKARHRYTNMYPSVPAGDFYNTFISRRRRERHNLVIPTDNLEKIEVPRCEAISEDSLKNQDGSSPLGKNLGNNSLYVVDSELLSKRRNTFKTQAEIDAEEDGFFSREEAEDTMISFLPKRKKNIDQKSEEYERIQKQNQGNPESVRSDTQKPAEAEEKTQNKNMPYDSEIPLDFDYQSFYRVKETKDEKDGGKEASDKEEETEKQSFEPCSFCGTLNPEDREECIFCGAQLKSEEPEEEEEDFWQLIKGKSEPRELKPCPFCGTLNPKGRKECIFCGIDIDSEI